MVIHDFICEKCNAILRNLPSRFDHQMHLEADRESRCSGRLVIYWQTSISRPAQLDISESTCIYYSPAEGKVQYPGRNDVPVPDRLRRRGYDKIWLRSDAEVGRFEREHGVVNERRHYDSNGRGYEDD